jgi:hypothetical protein
MPRWPPSATVAAAMSIYQATRAWTDRDIERLRKLVAQGLSDASIGRQVGRTPGSVHGKVDRLGLRTGTPRLKRSSSPAPVSDDVS